MYQPPPGRPISSPPAVNGHDQPTPIIRTRGADKFTQAERMALRADYAAGLSWVKIATKYNTYSAAVAAMTADMPRRDGAGRPRKDGRPVRNPGETAQQYANRVQLWKRATDPAWREAKSARMSAAIKKSWRKRKARAERERAAAEAAKVALEPATDIAPAIVVAPQPTLWQRIVGWFR